jgi:hypothetical protein
MVFCSYIPLSGLLLTPPICLPACTRCAVCCSLEAEGLGDADVAELCALLKDNKVVTFVR